MAETAPSRIAGDGAGAWLRAAALPSVVAALCARSLAGHGYQLQLDSVYGPVARPPGWSAAAPVATASYALQRLIGGEVAGRVVMIAALVLAGVAPMVLLRRSPWPAQCAAGLLGILNPFIDERVVDGQWGVVLAAASLFLWVAAWERLRDLPGWNSAVLCGSAGVLVVALDAHFALILAVLATGAVLAATRRSRRPPWRPVAVALGMPALATGLGAIVFFVTSPAIGYDRVRGFGRADFAAFQTTADPHLGAVPALLGLNGYWGERTGRFVSVMVEAPWWPATAAILVFLAIAGAWLQRERAWLLWAGLLGVAASAATALPGGLDGVAWVAERVPALSVYREPQKWDALWLVAIVTLAASAAERMTTPSIGHTRRHLGAVTAYAMVACTMLPGGAEALRALPGELGPQTYPAAWREAAAWMDANVPAGERVAVLPWHLYLVQPFTGRLTANPAPVAFSQTLVLSNDPELPGDRSGRALASPIALAALHPSDPGCGLAAALRAERVRFVIVEMTAEGPDDVVALRRCGFRLAAGSEQSVAVLTATP